MLGKPKNILFNAAISAGLLVAAFGAALLLQAYFTAPSLVPAIFVLAVFLISLMTDGYIYGVVSSFLGMLAVNYVFTWPYFAFDFSVPENLFSAVVMLAIAILTGALTIRLKRAEKLRAESETEKMRANLLRAVSHDLRTPLTTICGSCSAIIENYDRLTKAQQLKLLGEMRQEADWLTRMVENLLSVTRIDGGRVQVVKTPTAVEELADAVLTKFAKRYPGQPVAAELPDDCVIVPMDAVLIEQVLENLLENAVQHAEGMTKLTLRVRRAGPRAVFEVEDDGCGIPRERLHNLFAAALPAGDSDPRPGQKRGMGIGLSVCATIIRAHGGEISGENRPGGGAVFRFWLLAETGEE